MILPAAAWRARPGLATLCDVLGADDGAVRYVGGAVRDTLLGLDVADIDLATTHQPEAVIDLLERARIKAVATGLAHGTVTAILAGGPVEVTTLRRDVATDGRHAIVAFTDDWQADAERRDFTINALYADPLSGELFDYFGGVDDLARHRVRFIGDPLVRIAEDHLRILRFFRFHARFGDAPDALGLAACTARANDLMALSRERIAAELFKLLVATRAVPAVELMIERGIFTPVLPEISDATRLRILADREAEARIAPNAIRRLAALLPADAAVAENVGARLKLSKIDRRHLIAAASPADDAPPAAIAYRRGVDEAMDALLLSTRPAADAASLIEWQRPVLPVRGGELVARGVRKGPEVARLLHTIEDAWVAEGFPPAARAAEIADAAVTQWLRASSIA